MKLIPDSNNAATSFQWIAGGWSDLRKEIGLS